MVNEEVELQGHQRHCCNYSNTNQKHWMVTIKILQSLTLYIAPKSHCTIISIKRKGQRISRQNITHNWWSNMTGLYSNVNKGQSCLHNYVPVFSNTLLIINFDL